MSKSSAPQAPDYTKMAQMTAASNMAASQGATTANRVNQSSPYASVSWAHNPTTSFDQAGYQAAVDAYNKKQANPMAQALLWAGGGADNGDIPGATPQSADAMPTKDQFTTTDNNTGWSQNTTLDPRVQAIMDKYLADPNQGVMSGQSGQDAIMSRLNPQLTMEENQLRQRLANQGIAPGSEAFNNEMRQFNQGRNDQQTQAALYGINLDMNNRNQGLSVLNQYRTLANPNMPSVPQQGTVSGADYSGAANNQYQAALDTTNVNNANDSSFWNGLMNIGSTAMGMPSGSLAGPIMGAFGATNNNGYSQGVGSAYNGRRKGL